MGAGSVVAWSSGCHQSPESKCRVPVGDPSLRQLALKLRPRMHACGHMPHDHQARIGATQVVCLAKPHNTPNRLHGVAVADATAEETCESLPNQHIGVDEDTGDGGAHIPQAFVDEHRVIQEPVGCYARVVILAVSERSRVALETARLGARNDPGPAVYRGEALSRRLQHLSFESRPSGVSRH